MMRGGAGKVGQLMQALSDLLWEDMKSGPVRIYRTFIQAVASRLFPFPYTYNEMQSRSFVTIYKKLNLNCCDLSVVDAADSAVDTQELAADPYPSSSGANVGAPAAMRSRRVQGVATRGSWRHAP